MAPAGPAYRLAAWLVSLARPGARRGDSGDAGARAQQAAWQVERPARFKPRPRTRKAMRNDIIYVRQRHAKRWSNPHHTLSRNPATGFRQSARRPKASVMGELGDFVLDSELLPLKFVNRVFVG